MTSDSPQRCSARRRLNQPVSASCTVWRGLKADSNKALGQAQPCLPVYLAVWKQELHLPKAEQTEFARQLPQVDVIASAEESPDRAEAQHRPGDGPGEVVNERDHEVRLHEKPSVWCLDKQAPSHPANLRSEPLLILVTAQVLNHAIGVRNIEGLVREIHLSRIPDDARVPSGNRPGRLALTVQNGNRRGNRHDAFPVIHKPADIQNASRRSGLQPFQKELPAPVAKAGLDSGVKLVDAWTHTRAGLIARGLTGKLERSLGHKMPNHRSTNDPFVVPVEVSCRPLPSF